MGMQKQYKPCPICGGELRNHHYRPYCSQACRTAQKRALLTRKPEGCPWYDGTISKDLAGASPALGF